MKFSPKDFCVHASDADDCPHNETWECNGNENASKANARLQEMLKEATPLYGYGLSDTYCMWHEEEKNYPYVGRLVCVEEIMR